jgi:predicted DNA-binding transcriptional regulator YafY
MKASEQIIYNKLKTPIQEKRLVSFIYKDASGKEDFKQVEPFQVGIHQTTGNAILSAWYIPKNNKEKAGWRIYLLSAITSITDYMTTFNGDRPGFEPTSNQTMKEILISIGG